MLLKIWIEYSLLVVIIVELNSIISHLRRISHETPAIPSLHLQKGSLLLFNLHWPCPLQPLGQMFLPQSSPVKGNTHKHPFVPRQCPEYSLLNHVRYPCCTCWGRTRSFCCSLHLQSPQNTNTSRLICHNAP